MGAAAPGPRGTTAALTEPPAAARPASGPARGSARRRAQAAQKASVRRLRDRAPGSQGFAESLRSRPCSVELVEPGPSRDGGLPTACSFGCPPAAVTRPCPLAAFSVQPSPRPARPPAGLPLFWKGRRWVQGVKMPVFTVKLAPGGPHTRCDRDRPRARTLHKRRPPGDPCSQAPLTPRAAEQMAILTLMVLSDFRSVDCLVSDIV